MRNNYRSKKFKTWLDNLQQESWQLELLISGFAIYGLFQAIGPLEIKYEIAKNSDENFFSIAYVVALISCYILTFTLLLHILLRGLWIGALGLRYVSGDIDFKKLNYTPKFDWYLRRKIGSFDRYISRLEDYCSVLFALSFLLIFYVVSFFLFVGCLTGLTYVFLVQEGEYSSTLGAIGGVLILILIFGMLLVFIDFLTQGFLKKKKWLAFFYFPFYWVFSFITLSFLYRPLVYNFLDNRFGRKISLILVPIYFGVIFLSSMTNTGQIICLQVKIQIHTTPSPVNYDTVLTKEGVFVENASIPNKIITTNYLPIFIEYKEKIEDRVFEFNKDLKPDDDLRGFKSEISFSDQIRPKGWNDSLRKVYMETIKEIHIIKIDSITFNFLDYVFTQNKNNQLGFETVISLDSITQGKHTLKVFQKSKKEKNEKGTYDAFEVASIPFWYFSE